MKLNMASSAEVKKKNHESNILFIQQEHANTLKLLHEEIHNLQKRCSELTFQLAMETTSSPQEDFYREQVEKLEGIAEARQKKIEEYESLTEQQGQRIRFLEKQIKAQELKYRNDIRGKDNVIMQQEVELKQKAEMIADMNIKLLTMSKELKKRRNSKDQTAVAESIEINPLTPTPPKDGPPRVRRRSAGRSVKVEDLGSQRRPQPEMRYRQRRVRPETPEVVPDQLDPSPFLQHPPDKSYPPRLGLSTRKRDPLPPIARSAETMSPSPDLTDAPHNIQGYRNFTTVKKQKERGARARVVDGMSSPEVETLAVDQVLQQGHTLRSAREYNGREY